MKDSKQELSEFEKIHKKMLEIRKIEEAKTSANKKTDRVLMSDHKLKEIEKSEKDMENGEDRKVSTVEDREWRFIVSHDPKRGLKFADWQDFGGEKIDITGFLDLGDAMDLEVMLDQLDKHKKKERSAELLKKDEAK